MEVTAYVLGIAAIVTFGVAALLGVLHLRDATIWTTCLACVLTITGGFCWLQDREWKKEITSRSPKRDDNPASDRRPYIFVTSITSPKLERLKDAKLGAVMEVNFENSTDWPAFDVEAQVDLFLAFARLTAPPPFVPISSPPSRADLAPKGKFIVTPRGGFTFPDEPQAKIESGEIIMYLHGFVRYLDSKKTAHRYEFCVEYKPEDKTFEISPFGNSSD